MGTANGYLYNNGIRFAGRANDITVVVHGRAADQPLLLASNSFMNATSFSTPSLGKAL